MFVSIPSTSGHLFKQDNKTPKYSVGKFQSPPRRGIYSNETAVRAAGKIIMFQSPPHRGIYSNASGKKDSVSREQFQSPPHRGIYSNLCLGAARLHCVDGFNPLHIGASIQTQERLLKLWNRLVSIPSTSGHLFKLVDLMPTRAFLRVSIPSTSGHLFKHFYHVWEYYFLLMFQSPPHRGIYSNSSRVQKENEIGQCFNPLHIGASIQTKRH